MELRAFGNTNLRVSVLGFGGSEIGYQKVPQDQVNKILTRPSTPGSTSSTPPSAIPTAKRRSAPPSRTVARTSTSSPRVGHPTGDYAHEDYSAASIAMSIDRSLQRLKTDVLDLVQLHSCGKATLAKGECIQALEDAKKAGKTRFIGYSGDSFDAIAAVETGRFDALQISVSIADQQSIDAVLPLAAARSMGVIAKRPVANAAWKHAKEPVGDYGHEYWKRLQELKYAFLTKPLAESVAIALRFTLSQPAVHTAIVGTTKPGRWKENADSLRTGDLPAAGINVIRSRWKSVATPEWVGRV